VNDLGKSSGPESQNNFIGAQFETVCNVQNCKRRKSIQNGSKLKQNRAFIKAVSPAERLQAA
jgi:hypothetical protein